MDCEGEGEGGRGARELDDGGLVNMMASVQSQCTPSGLSLSAVIQLLDLLGPLQGAAAAGCSSEPPNHPTTYVIQRIRLSPWMLF